MASMVMVMKKMIRGVDRDCYHADDDRQFGKLWLAIVDTMTQWETSLQLAQCRETTRHSVPYDLGWCISILFSS
jgi:hypothetical protein